MRDIYRRARRLLKRLTDSWIDRLRAPPPSLRLTTPSSQPNTNELRVLTRDIEAMKLNIKNFGGPVTNINSTDFGRITSADNARTMQIGARFTF